MNFLQHKAHILLFVVMVLIGSTLAIPKYAQSQSGTLCPSGYAVGASGGTSGTSTVGGIINIFLGSPTSGGQAINKVVFRANGQVIGRGLPGVSGTHVWNMPWASALFYNGPTTIDAEVYFLNATTACNAQNTVVNVFNATTPQLTATIQPSQWQGPMSFSFPVSVSTRVQDIDVTAYALYTWSTTIGNVSPNHSQAQFFSGQTVGQGTINVSIKYGGKDAQIYVPISVQDAAAPLPPSTTQPSEGTDQTSQTDANQTIESTLRLTTLQNNPAAEECIVGALGQDRFNAINRGEARPTLEEIKKFNVCFATSNYILPTNFAPVAPPTIRELPKSDKLVVNKLENGTKQKDDTTIDTLRISGSAQPNSLVLIYIFSDPLVLTTTADENGNWTYTLEDPIEPGEHEIYSVVDRGDGVYERSDPISFFIGTAEAAEANPEGLSLRLVDEPTPAQSNRSLFLYAAASGSIILVVVTTLLIIIRKRRAAAESTATAPALATPATNPMNATDQPQSDGDRPNDQTAA